jgi:hypothetical protein
MTINLRWWRKGDENSERRKTATTYLYIVSSLYIIWKNEKGGDNKDEERNNDINGDINLRKCGNRF